MQLIAVLIVSMFFFPCRSLALYTKKPDGGAEHLGAGGQTDSDVGFENLRESVRSSYHMCDDDSDLYEADADESDLPPDLVLYTINRTAGNTTVDRDTCLTRSALDGNSNSSYIVLTMASTDYFTHLQQLVASLMAMPGLPPKKVVIADVGLRPNETKAVLSLSKGNRPPVEIVPYDIGPLQAIENRPDFPKGGSSGAYYRLKAIIVHEWFEKNLADQLMWMDAGGIVLGSTKRLRNFVAAEGFYAGTLPENALSQLVGGLGAGPDLHLENERQLTTNGVLPRCFDYSKDFQIDETVTVWKANETHPKKPSKSLGSFEAGLLVADSRYSWVHELLRRWSSIMASDELLIKNLAYFFPFDQKVLTNEIWKMAVCENPCVTRLVDANNIRFGTVAQIGEEPWKHHFTFKTEYEKVPWTGYVYHYCISGIPSYHCLDPHPHYNASDWVNFAAHSE